MSSKPFQLQGCDYKGRPVHRNRDVWVIQVRKDAELCRFDNTHIFASVITFPEHIPPKTSLKNCWTRCLEALRQTTCNMQLLKQTRSWSFWSCGCRSFEPPLAAMPSLRCIACMSWEEGWQAVPSLTKQRRSTENAWRIARISAHAVVGMKWNHFWTKTPFFESETFPVGFQLVCYFMFALYCKCFNRKCLDKRPGSHNWLLFGMPPFLKGLGKKMPFRVDLVIFKFARVIVQALSILEKSTWGEEDPNISTHCMFEIHDDIFVRWIKIQSNQIQQVQSNTIR